jgi:hypothetical protein
MKEENRMRRFRRRRRRLAAAALLPIAAIHMTATSFGAEPRSARIDASDRAVAVGSGVVLRGAFPGTRKAPFEIRYRAEGSSSWRTVSRDRTGASGAYKTLVRPRRSGHWRAELATAQPDAQRAIDANTGSERISVRSKTRSQVKGRHARIGDAVKVRGRVAPEGRRRVVVRIGNHKEATRTNANGGFSVRWSAGSTGTFPVRVKARTNRAATGSRDSAGRITVYRAASASWYGPGLYGGHLACGGTLTPSTMGVAHKTLPCGTKLRLRYRGRTVKVPVIDRGPYSGNREFDLTSATKNALRFPDLGTVLTSR